jgi:murein DD-endopeptidase MepM/ murein hydrolase activator NlpD
VAAGDSGAFLSYELTITNLTPDGMLLKRVEVMSAADTTRDLLSVADSSLNRIIARPGLNVMPSERTRVANGTRGLLYLWVPVSRGNAPSSLRHRLTFQRLAGDSATFTLSGAVTPVEPAAVSIRAPLRGEWMAANGPSNASGHRRTALALDGTVAIGQRFAIDFLQIDSAGRTWRPGTDSTDNASYYAYGNQIYSVGDGIVVETKDSIPENRPRSPVARAVPINLVTVGGNHIVVDMGKGHYAFYAHVQPGSLRVKLGDRVKAGQVLALLGNSGNSTEPHLHFHMGDNVSPLGSEGIPYSLPALELIGRCELSAAGVRCSRASPMTFKDAMPLQNQLVRFRD